jgi:hypothetical protein
LQAQARLQVLQSSKDKRQCDELLVMYLRWWRLIIGRYIELACGYS